jgi:hypothetical protein
VHQIDIGPVWQNAPVVFSILPGFSFWRTPPGRTVGTGFLDEASRTSTRWGFFERIYATAEAAPFYYRQRPTRRKLVAQNIGRNAAAFCRFSVA